MMSDTRGGSSGGLVRNVSLPVLHYEVPVSPRAAYSTVPRVSSFSRMAANPAPTPMYGPTYDIYDDDADGMVPDLEPHEDMLHQRNMARLRRPRPQAYDRDMEGESITDSDESAVARVVKRNGMYIDAGYDSTSDFSKADHGQSTRYTTSIPAQVSDLHANPFSFCRDSWIIAQIRRAILVGIAPMHIFIPPKSRTCAIGSPDLEAKFLFLSTLSMTIAFMAFSFSVFISQARSLLPLPAAIAFAPVVGRLSGSLPIATVTCACGVISYAVTAARLLSPVMLVWTSLVPVLAFAALGTRGGVASSFATAAFVFAVDFSGPLPEGLISPAGTIAAWVLFLGWTRVVQRQIKKLKFGTVRTDRDWNWMDVAYCSGDATSASEWDRVGGKIGEHAPGDVDAMVPDAGTGIVLSSTGY